MSTDLTSKIKIDIVSDVVCPWCFVGIKKLEQAMSQVSDRIEFEVEWRPFQLSPEMPKEGKDYKEHLTQKFGSIESLKGAFHRLNSIGKDVGINFDFESIPKATNTLALHSLIKSAPNLSIQNQLVMDLFSAHFEKGVDLTSKEKVKEIALHAGITESQFKDSYENASLQSEVNKEYQYYQQNGVSGVPFFILQNKFAVSGAQDPTVFRELFERCLVEDGSL